MDQGGPSQRLGLTDQSSLEHVVHVIAYELDVLFASVEPGLERGFGSWSRVNHVVYV
jgi:hypothetical protein